MKAVGCIISHDAVDGVGLQSVNRSQAGFCSLNRPVQGPAGDPTQLHQITHGLVSPAPTAAAAPCHSVSGQFLANALPHLDVYPALPVRLPHHQVQALLQRLERLFAGAAHAALHPQKHTQVYYIQEYHAILYSNVTSLMSIY